VTEQPRDSEQGPTRRWMQYILCLVRRGTTSGVAPAALVTVLVLLTAPVRYAVNDDMAAVSTLAGSDGFAASPAAPFVSQFLAYFLFGLYRIAPSVPWYGLTVYAALFVGFAVLFGITARAARRNGMFPIVVIPFFLIAAAHFVAFLTFTSAALLLAFGAVLILLESLLDGSDDTSRCNSMCMLAVGIFLLGYCLRWKLALFSLAFGCPVLFVAVKRHGRGSAAAIAVVCLFIAADRAAYWLHTATPMARVYAEYNAVRGTFHGTIRGAFYGKQTMAALEQTGWTTDDYVAFSNLWLLHDERLFNATKVNTFLAANRVSGRQTLRLFWKTIQASLKRSRDYALVMLLTILGLLASSWKRTARTFRQSWFLFLPLLLLLVLGILYLAYYRFVMWVYLPVYVYAAGLLLVLSNGSAVVPADRGQHRRRMAELLAAMGVFIVATLLCCKRAALEFDVLERSRTERDYVEDCLRTFGESVPCDTLLVLLDPRDQGGLGDDKACPLEPPQGPRNARVLPYGTWVRHPRYMRILRERGIVGGYDMLKTAIDADGIVFALFCRSHVDLKVKVALWESYYRRNVSTGREARMFCCADFRNPKGHGLIFLQLRTTAASAVERLKPSTRES